MGDFRDFLRRLEQGYTDQEVIALYLNSPTKISELCAKTGKSIGEFYRIIHNNNYFPNRLKLHHQHVVDYHKSGLSYDQIAELTGYTPRNVRYIVSKLKVD